MIRLIVVPGNNVVIGFQPYDLEKPFAGHVEQMGEQLQAQAIYRTASGPPSAAGAIKSG